jgi:hypothetical protein
LKKRHRGAFPATEVSEMRTQLDGGSMVGAAGIEPATSPV